MKKRYVVLIVLLVIGAVWFWFSLPRSYEYTAVTLPDTFDEYYAQQLADCEQKNCRPGNEQKLLRFSEGKTPIALLYIHGFSASRAEGEYAVDILAGEFGANTYYMRLPGHGTTKEDHASVTFRDYLDESITALKMMRKLGDKIVIVGTSMGGLIATYLAAEYPDLVDGLILTSPFYDYSSPSGSLLKIPGALTVVQWKDGKDRPTGKSGEFADRVQDGYDNYWYREQYYAALQSLEDLRNYASRSKYFEKVNVPVLMLAYYKDEEYQDGAASVEAMEKTYNEFASTKAGQNQFVKLPDANHVMLSQYVRTDKNTILATIRPFLEQFNK